MLFLAPVAIPNTFKHDFVAVIDGFSGSKSTVLVGDLTASSLDRLEIQRRQYDAEHVKHIPFAISLIGIRRSTDRDIVFLEIKEIRDGYHPSNRLKRSKCDDKVTSKEKDIARHAC